MPVYSKVIYKAKYCSSRSARDISICLPIGRNKKYFPDREKFLIGGKKRRKRSFNKISPDRETIPYSLFLPVERKYGFLDKHARRNFWREC